MNKWKHRLAALLMVAAVLLSGCTSSGSDTAEYLESMISSVYLGEHESYMESVDIAQEEAEDVYLDRLQSESLYFASRLGFIQSDDTLYRTMAFFRQVYGYSAFSVSKIESTEKGYQAEIEITPVNLFVEYEAEIEARVLQFSKRVSEGEFDGQTQREIDCQYCNDLLNFLDGKLDDKIPMGEPYTMTITLQETDGGYTVSGDDLLKIEQSLVPYPEA